MGCKPLEMKQKYKHKHRKGLWSPDEDERLRKYILDHGHGSWSSIPSKAGLQRNGKSCRLRWINYLRPGLRRDTFTSEEDDNILKLHATLGNKWSQIAQYLPGRTDNEIKNHWHSNLKKKVIKVGETSNSTTQLTQSHPNHSYHLLDRDLLSTTTVDVSNVQPKPRLQDQQIRSFLPKVVFADWLTMDTHSNDLTHQSINSYGYDIPYSSIVQSEFVQSEGSCLSGSLTSNSEFGCNNVVSCDDQAFNVEENAQLCGFDEFFYGEGIFSDFKMPCDNFMFI